MHRANAASDSIEGHYRVNVYFPFLDFVLQELQRRFPTDIKPMLYAYYLIPHNMGKLNETIVTCIDEEFGGDMPKSAKLPART